MISIERLDPCVLDIELCHVADILDATASGESNAFHLYREFRISSAVAGQRYHEMGSPPVIADVETFLFKTCVSSERWMHGKDPTVSCTR